MSKVKYNHYITRGDIDTILLERFPKHKCPTCGKEGVYAGYVEDQYDEKHEEDVVLSFDIFCKECGAVLGKWDNTNREYFLGRR